MVWQKKKKLEGEQKKAAKSLMEKENYKNINTAFKNVYTEHEPNHIISLTLIRTKSINIYKNRKCFKRKQIIKIV